MCLSLFVHWVSRFVPQLILRILIAWQAWEFGFGHYNAAVQNSPLQTVKPLNLLPAQISWDFLMWCPILGAIFLILGFQVRLAATGLLLIAACTMMSYLPIEFTNLVDFWYSQSADALLVKSELLMVFLLLILLFLGGGGLSIDALTFWAACGLKARNNRKLHKKNSKIAKKAKAVAKKKKIEQAISNRKIIKAQKKAAKIAIRQAREVQSKTKSKEQKNTKKATQKTRNNIIKSTEKPIIKRHHIGEIVPTSIHKNSKISEKNGYKTKTDELPINKNKFASSRMPQTMESTTASLNFSKQKPPRIVSKAPRIRLKKDIDDMIDADFCASESTIS